MANERQELDRLRKLKRLRELEAKTTIQGVQNDIPTNGLGTPSANGLATEQVRPRAQVAPQAAPQGDGFLSSVGEFFTGSERETEATKRLPEIGSGGLLFGEDKAKTAAITPALLTATDPMEMGEILRNNFESIGVTQDEKGNFFATNNKTGAQVVLNKPGVSQIDILQGLGIAAAFTPAGRLAGTARIAGGAGATSAGVEALQSLSGGEFDASQVAIDTVTAGVLDKAFEVAKATGRGIRDVLKNDAKVDPDQLLKSFAPRGTASKLAKQAVPAEPASKTVQKATQADLTPEALEKIRQAKSIDVQLTKAHATGDFGATRKPS